MSFLDTVMLQAFWTVWYDRLLRRAGQDELLKLRIMGHSRRSKTLLQSGIREKYQRSAKSPYGKDMRRSFVDEHLAL